MNDWSTDKIVGSGLVIALIVSIIAGVWTGNGIELQTTLGSGLIGYMGRAVQEKAYEIIRKVKNNEDNGKDEAK